MRTRALEEGLKSHVHAIKCGFVATIFNANQLLMFYSKNGLAEAAHKLFDEMSQKNVFSWNAIITAYIKSQNLAKAETFFDCCPCKDSVTYNSLISGYCRSEGYENDAIEFFICMRRDNHAARIDEFTLTTMLNLISRLKILDYGRQIHSFMVKSGNDLSAFASSSLIDMYSKCGNFHDGCRIFNDGRLMELVVRNTMIAACCREGELDMARMIFMSNTNLNDIVSWNTMISGCVQNGHEKEAIEVFQCMPEKGFVWNEHTFSSLLSACSNLKNMTLGMQVHSTALKKGTMSNPFINSGIVDTYCKCGNMMYAVTVHETFGIGNLFSTTAMIVGQSAEGNIVEARRLFDSSSEKNYVMWTSIIAGYVKLQKCEDAFALFRQLTAEQTSDLDVLILINMLGACSIRARMVHGKQIHAYIVRTGIQLDEKSLCALVDMYSKCGSILYAERVFKRNVPRDSVVYNVMIASYAHHGYEHEAIKLFENMREQGHQPDAVTFVALLSACRHRGLVEDGEKYFWVMVHGYRIPPEIDHYACMVDLYVRSNQLNKALAFIETMDMEPDSVIWSTFLNGCRGNENLELARVAENKLLEFEGDNGARYVQLASVYASGGNWDEMGRVMKKMRGKEVKKLVGYSWLHIGNAVHNFTSGDKSHLEAKAIYDTLGSLVCELYETILSVEMFDIH